MYIDDLKTKRDYYSQKLDEIRSTNIDDEVNKRLGDVIKKIQEEVIAELTADEAKCRHYLELLDSLIGEFENKEEPVNEEPTIENIEETTNVVNVEGENYVN